MRDICETEVDTVWLKEHRRKNLSRFLKGPIPLTALQHAARLPGKTLALYLALRHRADLASTSTVSLPASYLNAWGIDKDAKHRAIAALERAELVRVVNRAPGRSMRVALVEGYESTDSECIPPNNPDVLPRTQPRGTSDTIPPASK